MEATVSYLLCSKNLSIESKTIRNKTISIAFTSDFQIMYNTTDKMRKSGLKGYMHAFSVDFGYS